MVGDELERMNMALAKIEGGKIKAITDGDRVYLMIQDAPEELRRLADALEKLNINEIKALVAYANPGRRESQRVKAGEEPSPRESQRNRVIDAAAAPRTPEQR